MSKFTKETVDSLAAKLLIGLTEEENNMVLNEFEEIESNMELINEIPNISLVEPMTHSIDNESWILREDIAEESYDIEKLLQNASKKIDREIEVPKVVGD